MEGLKVAGAVIVMIAVVIGRWSGQVGGHRYLGASLLGLAVVLAVVGVLILNASVAF